MAAPIRFLSGRQQQQKIGVTGSTEDKKVLEVVGRVGIGTTIFEPGVELDVRGNVNVSGVLTATSINIAESGDLDIGGNLTVSGLSTFTEAADFNGDVDIDGHTEIDNLNVSGISTFTSDVDINASVDILDNLVVNNNFSVSGVTTLASSGGITTTGGDFYVGGDLYVLDDLVFDELSARNATLSGFTTTGELRVTGFSTFVGVTTFVGVGSDSAYFEKNVYINDDASLFFGTGHDLEILHDEIHSIIQDRGTGDLQIASNGTGVVIKKYDSGEEIARFTPDDSVNLYYDGVSKFETTGTGVTVYGQTESQELLVTGISTFSSDLDVNSSIDVDGHTELDNLNVSGVSTFALAVDINNDIDVDGHTELDNLNISGFSTFASNLDINASVDVLGDLDVNDHTELDNLNVSGVSTFIGAIAGTISTATALETARDFEITGDVVATAISFDGTGNVSLAATIQPNSVGLGTDTTGDYVRHVNGTVNQITVTGGTGESSTPTLSLPSQVTLPQDLTVTRDVQIDRNLNVDGNITIGGTSATLFTETLKVSDADIVLGFTTNYANEDASTDTTANHGGVAVASTEGTPLINLAIAGIETLPATYKKIMWFKEGTFSGLGTDAWLSNYAVGIGSTQFPTGTRLAAGSVQISENDITQVRNINVSGVSTFSGDIEVGTGITFYSNTGIISAVAFYGSGENLSDILQNKIEGLTAKFQSDPIGLGLSVLGQELRTVSFEIIDQSTTGIITAVGFGSTAQYYFNPITAVGLTTYANVETTGVITATKFVGSGAGGQFIGDGSGLTNVTAVAAGVTVFDNGVTVGTASILDFGPDIDVTAISAGVVTFSLNGEQDFSGIVTASSLYADNKIGINTTAPHGSALLVNGDAWVSGVVTATKFLGDGTGLTGVGATVLNTSTNTTFFPTFAIDEGSSVELSISKSSFGFNPSTSRLGIGSTNPSANLEVVGSTELDNLNVSGVSTFYDRVIFDSTNSIQIPVGTEGEKDAVGVAVTGQIRFNTTNQQFEGFGVGNNWGSLGGVKDVDGDTYILAETTAGSDEDILYFYTGGNLSGILSTAGADFNVDLNVDGHTELDNLRVSGIATFQNDVLVGSAITISSGAGIVTATKFVGDGSELTGVSALSISTSTSSNAQSIAFVSAASTNVIGIADTQFTFIPSTTRMGIGVANPGSTLEINVGTATSALDIQGSEGQLFSVTNNLTSGSIFSVNDVSGIPSIDVDADGTIQLAPFGASENVGVGTTNPQAKLDVVGDITANYVTIGSAAVGLTTTDQTAIHTGLSTSVYRSVEYNIQVGQGTNFHATKIIALHDGSNAYSNEYGTVYNNSSIATFDVDVSGGNMRLLATGASVSQTDYIISFTATKS